jgi:hypothetical protein
LLDYSSSSITQVEKKQTMKTNKPDSKKEVTTKVKVIAHELLDEQSEKKNDSCQRPVTAAEERIRKGRKSLVATSNRNAKNKVRYIEGTTPLKDGCWLSD